MGLFGLIAMLVAILFALLLIYAMLLSIGAL